MWEGVRPGRREGVEWQRRKRHVHGEGPTQGWGGQGTRGAHGEHVTLVRDAGHVEVERLVERPRVLPSRRAGMRCGKRCGPGGVRALGGGDASGMHGEGPTQGCGGQGTRGAHVEHAVHVRDLGRVEAERLVELVRGLPSRKVGMRRGKRYSPGDVRALGGAATQLACAREGPDSRLCVGRQGTRPMPAIFRAIGLAGVLASTLRSALG